MVFEKKVEMDIAELARQIQVQKDIEAIKQVHIQHQFFMVIKYV